MLLFLKLILSTEVPGNPDSLRKCLNSSRPGHHFSRHRLLKLCSSVMEITPLAGIMGLLSPSSGIKTRVTLVFTTFQWMSREDQTQEMVALYDLSLKEMI